MNTDVDRRWHREDDLVERAGAERGALLLYVDDADIMGVTGTIVEARQGKVAADFGP